MIEASNSTNAKDINVDQPASSTEDDDNMEQIEQTIQVQWLHCWFKESTLDDLALLPAADT